MLIEKPGIYEHMTALENLRYFSLLFGIQSQDHHRILEMVGLQNAEKKKACQFSLGMNFWWKTKCVCLVWGQTMKTLRNSL